MILTEIPVKPYIKTFLEQRFGNPVDMNQSSFIGKFFHLLLRNGSRHKDKFIKLTGYTAKVTVKITEDVFLRDGHVLTSSSIAVFNTTVGLLIEDNLCLYLSAIDDAKELMSENKRVSKKDCMHKFIETFGFDDGSFEFDAVKKRHQRYTKKVLSPKMALEMRK
jgi:hypothetical protein